MANASETVKGDADVILLSNNEDGALRFLSEYLEKFQKSEYAIIHKIRLIVQLLESSIYIIMKLREL